MERELKLAGVAVVALLVGGLILKKRIDDAGGMGQIAQDIAADTISGAVEVANGVVTGGVLGIGDAVGLPRTEMNACELAIAEGRTWDASFACPAGRFLEYLTSGR